MGWGPELCIERNILAHASSIEIGINPPCPLSSQWIYWDQYEMIISLNGPGSGNLPIHMQPPKTIRFGLFSIESKHWISRGFLFRKVENSEAHFAKAWSPLKHVFYYLPYSRVRLEWDFLKRIPAPLFQDVSGNMHKWQRFFPRGASGAAPRKKKNFLNDILLSGAFPGRWGYECCSKDFQRNQLQNLKNMKDISAT